MSTISRDFSHGPCNELVDFRSSRAGKVAPAAAAEARARTEGSDKCSWNQLECWKYWLQTETIACRRDLCMLQASTLPPMHPSPAVVGSTSTGGQTLAAPHPS